MMGKTVVMFICLVLGNAQALAAENCKTGPLVQLLTQYSDVHGTKFIIDPRVQARVTTVGIDQDNLDAVTLLGILEVHGFAALASNDLVYILPESIASASRDKYGDYWKG